MDGVKTTLVEPDPKNIKAINEFFEGKSNITLHTCAIFDYNGTLELSQREASTFVSSLKESPAIINDHYVPNEKDKFEVECKRFDVIDDGTIDLLSIDTEGCEWYVLKNLISRPKVLSVETHGKSYTNPFLNEINNWVLKNDYLIWYKDMSDTVFIKNKLVQLTLHDKLALILINFHLTWRRLKYKIKRSIHQLF
jgi:FkbM family methyltransferase